MMGRHKKVMCKVCYREMRNDVLARHMKQHSMRNESSPVTNISVTNNYNTISGVSTERKDEENENKDEELKKYLIKIENEYQEKLVQGKKIYRLVGEGVVSYKALPYELKEEVDLYMENQEDFREVGNVKLKPWQESLLEYVQQPCDREIFWLWKKKVMKESLGSRNMSNLGLEQGEW